MVLVRLILIIKITSVKLVSNKPGYAVPKFKKEASSG